MQKTHIIRDYLFLNKIFMMGEMRKERKNNTVIPVYKKSDKTKAETYKEICLLNTCYEI
jgi:hypothetical protein